MVGRRGEMGAPLSVVPPDPLARGREVVILRQRGATRPLRRVEQCRIIRRLGRGVDTRLPTERRLALALHPEVDLVVRHSTAERGNVNDLGLPTPPHAPRKPPHTPGFGMLPRASVYVSVAETASLGPRELFSRLLSACLAASFSCAT
eukprot:scaffold3938_cov30-Phaeocystis_antarctica.AAC.4